MAKKKAAAKKAAPKKAPPRPIGKVEALRTYRCGEPDGGTKEPPEVIKELMVKAFGQHARIFKGGVYGNFPRELAEALINDGAAKEVR